MILQKENANCSIKAIIDNRGDGSTDLVSTTLVFYNLPMPINKFTWCYVPKNTSIKNHWKRWFRIQLISAIDFSSFIDTNRSITEYSIRTSWSKKTNVALLDVKIFEEFFFLAARIKLEKILLKTTSFRQIKDLCKRSSVIVYRNPWIV